MDWYDKKPDAAARRQFLASLSTEQLEQVEALRKYDRDDFAVEDELNRREAFQGYACMVFLGSARLKFSPVQQLIILQLLYNGDPDQECHRGRASTMDLALLIGRKQRLIQREVRGLEKQGLVVTRKKKNPIFGYDVSRLMSNLMLTSQESLQSKELRLPPKLMGVYRSG